MPFPRWLARMNLHVTNRILGPFARFAPGIGVVIHVGRKSHLQYRTPVMVFRRGNRLIIALTYGRDSQWVQNVLAASGCEIETRRRKLRLTEPHLIHDEERQNMPVFVRFFLGVLNVSDFLQLTIDQDVESLKGANRGTWIVPMLVLREGTFSTNLFPCTLPCQRLLNPASFAWLQVVRVTFHFSNDVFGLNLTFEPTERIL
jgi:deazaflavin-dependent oxidoreductase (nitroreductase family)